MSGSRGLVGEVMVRASSRLLAPGQVVLAPGVCAARAGLTPSVDGFGSPARDQRRQRRGPRNNDVRSRPPMNAVAIWAPAVAATMPLFASNRGR